MKDQSVLDKSQEHRQVVLYRRLGHAEGKADRWQISSVSYQESRHRRPQLKPCRNYGSGESLAPAVRTVRAHEGRNFHAIKEESQLATVRFGTDCIDAGIGAA
jgi:hypothetical protein